MEPLSTLFSKANDRKYTGTSYVQQVKFWYVSGNFKRYILPSSTEECKKFAIKHPSISDASWCNMV